jgi:membrane-bound lytic murein transglycosylase D
LILIFIYQNSFSPKTVRALLLTDLLTKIFSMKNSVKHQVIKSSAVKLVIFLLAISLSGFVTTVTNEDHPTKEKKVADNSQSQNTFSDTAFDSTGLNPTPLNSKAIPFVKKYINAKADNLEKIKIRGKKYFEIYDRILASYGLPKELKYLSVIESELTSKAVSPVGAVGPWQIMAEEAVRMGLKVNKAVDERKSFKKSTHAAAKILKELYAQFNDWTLVIAAYNCGDGRVRQAIRKSGGKNFWYLQRFLPYETRCHVKRFIGTHFFLREVAD